MACSDASSILRVLCFPYGVTPLVDHRAPLHWSTGEGAIFVFPEASTSSPSR